jgi:(1->4)-alpha-D-glucan 1-alpha-D-glucosylmutase
MRIMENEMASELNVLAREAGRVARSNPLTADFTDNVIRRAIKDIVAVFPVYRTYVDGSGPATEADRRDIQWAIAQARRRDDAIDPSVFDFLHQLLTGDLVAAPRSGFSREAVFRVAMRAQQYSGPVMAKGLEDTAFFRYNRLLALNEVGGQPDRFGVSVVAFHHANLQRAKTFPHAMLSTSTHDTKRGEDARARLAVLSEIPDDWARQVSIWSRILRAQEAGSSEQPPPGRNDEYAFYQILLGAWPPGLSTEGDSEELSAFCDRIQAAMLKTVREAKVHTSWAAPNAAYEEPIAEFVRHALDGSRPNAFLQSFKTFYDLIAPMGVHNSIVQTVLKLTVPGVPDIYQGADLWDFNLVDPDNRRPVDYEVRKSMLATDRGMGHLLGGWEDGGIKQRLIAALLQLRRNDEQLFQLGSYEPLTAVGPHGDRVCAFLRRGESSALITAVALRPSRGAEVCETDTNELPSGVEIETWTDALTGRNVSSVNGRFNVAKLFETLPVAVLRSCTTAHS